MSEETQRDLKAIVNGNAKWLALAVALLGGGGGSAWAFLRGEDPRVAELEAKIEAGKEKRIERIETDVATLKEGFERMDRNIYRIGERVRAKDLENGDER